MSATSTADAWAVGDQCPTCGNPGTLILHWNGTTWSMVPSPNPGPKGSVLNAVAAVSPSDAWAVGTSANSMCSQAATVILHWNGTKWSQVKSPNSGGCNFLNGVNASSATSAWAVGGSCVVAVNHCHTLIERWNGTAWSKVTSPNPGGELRALSGVSADSPSDAWAAGSYCTTSSCAVRDTMLLHWNGTTWSKVPSPNPGPTSNSLNGVTAVSSTDVWVTGEFCAPKCGGHVRTLIMHWNGTAWTTVSSPDPGNISFLTGVAATSSGNAWTVGGTCLTSVCGVNIRALVLHWDGTAWTVSSG